MPTGTRRSLAVLTALSLATGGAVTYAAGASALPPGGELVYGLTAADEIVVFRADAPGTVLDRQGIDLPLLTTTDIVGIDVRPRTGELYALGRNGQLYVVDPATGGATARGSAITPALSGTVLGVDFDPVRDLLRVVTEGDQNYRVDPDTGGASLGEGSGGLDGTVRYRAGDQNVNQNPAVGAVAHTSNVDGAGTTVQYDLDLDRDVLVRQEGDSGLLDTVGPLSAGNVEEAGLDISGGTGAAYAVVRRASTAGGTEHVFGRVDLGTGRFTATGRVGAGTTASPALAVEDITAATARFVVQGTTVAEGGSATVTVRRTGDTAEAQSVRYRYGTASADANDDVVGSSALLSFGTGQTTATFSVTALDDDYTEGTEVLAVQLSDATAGAAAGGPSAATLSSALVAANDPRTGIITITDGDAGPATGLTVDNRLVSFDVRTPGTLSSLPVPVNGLPSGVDLLGIDTRPLTGQLIGLGSDARFYALDRSTGRATALGEPVTPALRGSGVGIDVDPTADLVRLVTDTDQNLRVPVTGGASRSTAPTADGDNPLAYAAGDRSAGVNPAVVAAGYTNSSNNAARTATPTATTLFDLDTATDSLVRQDPPNAGVLHTVGTGLGFTITDDAAVGLDIAAAGGAAFASFRTGTTPGNPLLYRVSTSSGRAFALGALPTQGGLVEDIALTGTTAATFTPPGATPTPTATGTASPTPSATPTSTTSPTPSASPTGTTTPAPPAVRIRLSVAQDTITPGVEGVVEAVGVPRATIELLAYSRPSTDYRVVRTAQLDDRGRHTFRILPGTNTRLYARYQRVPGTDSDSVVQNVATAMSLTVVRNGSLDYTFQGRLLPRRAGQLITLYRVDQGREFITSQLRTDSTGTYRIRRVFQGQGLFGFVTRTGQNLTNVAGASNGGRPRPTAIYAGPQR